MIAAAELLPVSVESIAVAAAIIVCGYFVFGVSGFGSALLTVPVLSHLWPMTFVLPVLSLLDVIAAAYLGVRHHRQAERGELTRMIPLAFIGALIGALLLVNLSRTATQIGVGALVLLYALYTLVERADPPLISRGWAYVSGISGGAIGALFGFGGPAYAIYLSRRIRDKSVLRATVATMVIFSVGSRLVIFIAAGLVRGGEITVALILLPFVFIGLWVGGHVHLRMSRLAFLRAISAILAATGVSLLWRALAA